MRGMIPWAVIALLVLAFIVLFTLAGSNTGLRDAAGRSISLHDNRYAVDVSWDELKDFVVRDGTYQHAYDYPNYTCLDYAAELHDRAETAGIRCSLAMFYYDKADGHVANRFNTTDRGVVYVDDIGFPGVVYAQVGKPLGKIGVVDAQRFDYAYYESYVGPHAGRFVNVTGGDENRPVARIEDTYFA